MPRSRERALQRGAVGGRTVRREHELDRKLEQVAQPLEDLLRGLARPAVGPVEREDEALAPIDQRVAGDERAMAR